MRRVAVRGEGAASTWQGKAMPRRRRDRRAKVLSRPAKRKSRFAVHALDVTLGSDPAKKRPGAHVVGRPFTNYVSLKHGSAAVDVIADRLSNDEFEKSCLRNRLRNAVLLAHDAGSRKILEYNAEDHAGRADAALRALHALSELVYDPSFIPAIGFAAPIAAAEHPSYGEQVLDLVRALDNATLIEEVLADARRRFKPIKRQNPGRPYMAAFADSLVTSWQEQTGALPAKTRKEVKRSNSLRVLFWDFANAAMVDLSLKRQPIESHVRAAIDRIQGVRPDQNRRKTPWVSHSLLNIKGFISVSMTVRAFARTGDAKHANQDCVHHR